MSYDPNPYDNKSLEEALDDLFNRFSPFTVRQAIFAMANNSSSSTYATFAKKSIETNGAYAAADDGVTGYTHVNVNVPAVPDTSFIMTYGDFTYGQTPMDPGTLSGKSNQVMVIFPTNNEVRIDAVDDNVIYANAMICRECNKIVVDSWMYNLDITFKASANFDGIYSGDTKLTFTGPTIEAGKWYNALLNNNGAHVIEANDDLHYTPIVD